MSTLNNNLGAPQYTPQYRQALETVFGVRRAFDNALMPLQLHEGIRHNAKAFTLKTNNTPVVIGTYDKGANVGMGTGTGKSNRFGDRTEVIYTDTDVPYDYELSIHEGLDITTVNNDLEAAVIDRLYLQSEAQVRKMNERHGEFISTNAGVAKVIPAALTSADVLELFNDASTDITNLEVVVPVTAYVAPDLFNAIVDNDLTTTSKGSTVNIDGNIINDFKGFRIEKLPERYFAETDTKQDVAYFVPNGSILPFVGIELARAIESEDFAGVALQALAKGGTFIMDDNKKAVIKATLGE